MLPCFSKYAIQTVFFTIKRIYYNQLTQNVRDDIILLTMIIPLWFDTIYYVHQLIDLETYSIIFNCLCNCIFIYSAIPIDTTLRFNVILTTVNWIIRINSIFQLASKETVKLDKYHDCELERNRNALSCDLSIAVVCVTKVSMVAVKTHSNTNTCNVLIDINCQHSNIDLVSHGINLGHAHCSVICTMAELAVKTIQTVLSCSSLHIQNIFFLNGCCTNYWYCISEQSPSSSYVC